MSYKKFLFGFLLIFVFVLAMVVQPIQTGYAAGTVPTKKPTSKSGTNNSSVLSTATLISVKTLTPTGNQGQGAAASTKKPTKTKVPTRTKTPTKTATPTITNTPNPASATSTEAKIEAVASSSTPTFTPTITPVPGNANVFGIFPTEYIKYIYMFCGLLIILAIILIIFLILRRGKQQNNPTTPPDSTPPAQ
jgi:hypothetical protein